MIILGAQTVSLALVFTVQEQSGKITRKWHLWKRCQGENTRESLTNSRENKEVSCTDPSKGNWWEGEKSLGSTIVSEVWGGAGRVNEPDRAVGTVGSPSDSSLSSEDWVESSREMKMCFGKSLQVKGDVTRQNLSVCNDSRIKFRGYFGAWRWHLLMWTYSAKTPLGILEIKRG